MKNCLEEREPINDLSRLNARKRSDLERLNR